MCSLVVNLLCSACKHSSPEPNRDTVSVRCSFVLSQDGVSGQERNCLRRKRRRNTNCTITKRQLSHAVKNRVIYNLHSLVNRKLLQFGD